jgi:hypothetical protein
MVAYAKRWNIKVLASSNLSLRLERSYLERLVRSGLDRLKVGIEGTNPETYASVQSSRRFRLVLANMRTIQEIKAELGVRHPKSPLPFMCSPTTRMQSRKRDSATGRGEPTESLFPEHSCRPRRSSTVSGRQPLRSTTCIAPKA